MSCKPFSPERHLGAGRVWLGQQFPLCSRRQSIHRKEKEKALRKMQATQSGQIGLAGLFLPEKQEAGVRALLGFPSSLSPGGQQPWWKGCGPALSKGSWSPLRLSGPDGAEHKWMTSGQLDSHLRLVIRVTKAFLQPNGAGENHIYQTSLGEHSVSDQRDELLRVFKCIWRGWGNLGSATPQGTCLMKDDDLTAC